MFGLGHVEKDEFQAVRALAGMHEQVREMVRRKKEFETEICELQQIHQTLVAVLGEGGDVRVAAAVEPGGHLGEVVVLLLHRSAAGRHGEEDVQ